MLLGADAWHRHAFHEADRLVLAIVVEQHQAFDLIGHRCQLLVARVVAQFVALHRVVEQDLDVDFVIRGIDAGRVVDEVGIEQHAIQCGLDAAALGETEVAALAHQLAAQLAAVDADRVVGAVADIGMGFGRGLHVGADAAVPEQIDRCLENRTHQVVRRQLKPYRLRSERRAYFRREWNRLGTAREDAATLADQLSS